MSIFSATPSFWADRFKASGIHLGLSLAVAILAATLVFGLWYPYPYREISGGRELFILITVVDVILGPLVTFAVFNRLKAKTELRRDLAIVGLIQLAALLYGLNTVFIARPVHLVFEYNRFNVVHAVDIPEEVLTQGPKDIEPLPLWGPTLLSLRPFKDNNEQTDATLADMGGLPLSAQTKLWQPYEQASAQVLQQARPLSHLLGRFPQQADLIQQAVKATGQTAESLAYLQMVGRKTFWTVLVDAKTARVLAFIPLDSF